MERNEPVHKVNTFLLTDVEGSTSLWESEPGPAAEAIQRHEQIIGDTVDRNGGFLVKSKGEGDATFCVFETPENALNAAINIQSLLASENWATSRPIRVRIAIHQGTADARDGDFYGPTINRCSRIRSVGHGGQILLSESAHENCNAKIPLRDHGPHRLKDLLSPERIYEAQWSNEPFPPLLSLNVLDHNLPVQLTNFVGREKEISEVIHSLEHARIVTIIGVGGTGKTRLSFEICAEIAFRGKQTIRFVSLSDLARDSQIDITLSRTLGCESRGLGSEIEVIAKHIGQSHYLILLDNCEHVVESSALVVSTLISSCPNLKILATSRQPLDVVGEQVHALDALPLPEIDELHPVRLREYDSVNLLLDRIRQRRPSFALDSGSAKGVVSLLHALDGIPLAIEHVAARIGSLGLDSVIERLGHRLDLLKTSDRFANPRQQTVRATLEWSHSLFDSIEREVFASLGCFRGTFVKSEADLICGYDVFDVIESLINKSMVTQVHFSSHETGYRLLETVKEFAEELIDADAPEAWSRHTAWCIDIGKKIGGEIEGQASGSAFSLLDRLYADLIFSLSIAIDRKDTRAINFAFSLRKPWLRRGPVSDGVRLLERVLVMDVAIEATMRADFHNALGAMAMTLGDKEKALKNLQEAAVIFNGLDLPTKAAASLANMGILRAMEGEFEEAEPLFNASLTAYESGGDKHGAAKVALNFGRMLVDADRFDSARPYLESALTQFATNDPVRESLALMNLTYTMSCEENQIKLEYLERVFLILMHSPDHSLLTVGLIQISRMLVEYRKFKEALILLNSAEACLHEGLEKRSVATNKAICQIHEAIKQELPESAILEARAIADTLDVSKRIRLALSESKWLKSANYPVN